MDLGLAAAEEPCAEDEIFCFVDTGAIERGFGGFLLAVWMIGSIVVVFVGASRKRRQPGDSGRAHTAVTR